MGFHPRPSLISGNPHQSYRRDASRVLEPTLPPRYRPPRMASDGTLMRVDAGTTPIRVLLADDEPGLRTALGELLSHVERVELIGTAPDAKEAIRIAGVPQVLDTTHEEAARATGPVWHRLGDRPLAHHQ